MLHFCDPFNALPLTIMSLQSAGLHNSDLCNKCKEAIIKKKMQNSIVLLNEDIDSNVSCGAS